MKSNTQKVDKQQRAFEVDMSSEAITCRLRDAGELNQLGISLAKAKPCPPPQETSIPLEAKP